MSRARTEAPGDTPPDEWDENETETNVPTARVAALRAAWIRAVRAHHVKHQNTTCGYTPGPYLDGGYDTRTRRNYKPKWPTILARADAAGFDALALVEVLFDSLMTDSVPPVYALVASENLDRLHRRGATRAARVADAARTEEQAFQTALYVAGSLIVDPHAAVGYALNDMGRPLSPLFRYCMSIAVGRYDIASRWRDAARQQFDADEPAYRVYWKHLLPVDPFGPNDPTTISEGHA